jgi:drug/metabolite transporter (DMT)-like permease
MNKKLVAHPCLFCANLIYAINYTVAKDVMPDYIQPSGFIFMRVSGALALFWLSYRLYHYQNIERKDLIRLILCGLFGVAINQILFFEGLNLTTPINASVIMVTNPILVLIIGAILISEKITFRKLIGIGFGAAGAYTLITNGGEFNLGNQKHSLGNMLVLINACSYGIYLVMVKPLMKKYHAITVISWVFLFGFIFVIPFGYNEFISIDWSTMPKNIIYKIIFVVFATTFLAYLFNIIGLKSLNPTTVSTYIYLQPILATLVAILAQSDELDWNKIISSGIIFIGVYLVSVNKKKQAT